MICTESETVERCGPLHTGFEGSDIRLFALYVGLATHRRRPEEDAGTLDMTQEVGKPEGLDNVMGDEDDRFVEHALKTQESQSEATFQRAF